MRKILSFIIIFLFCAFCAIGQLYSQKRTIEGKITDASTNEPIPFANIFFPGTTIGTISDFDGKFTLQFSTPADSLKVSCVGYLAKAKAVINKDLLRLDFQLTPSTISIPEVSVTPGENPAHRIIREAIKNKQSLNISNLDAYETETYTRTELALNNISDSFKQRKSMRNFKPLFDSLMVSAGEDGSLVLPMLFTETFSDIYYLKEPERKKEVINGSHVKGVGIEHVSDFVAQLVGTSFHDYNFNNNWVKILDKNVMSPIANGAFSYYKYYLIDSVYIDDKLCFEIRVLPKRSNDVVFSGNIWIQDEVFALKRIVVDIGKNADLNFVDKYKVQQDLFFIDSNIWVPKKTRVIADFSQAFDSTIGVLARLYIVNNNYDINKPKDIKFYSDKIEYKYDANDHDQDYWQLKRPEKLSQIDQNIYNSIDSINNFPRVKTYVDVIETLVNGYYRIGGFEIGPYLLIYGRNDVEGNRFRLGFRTNADFSKKWVLKGYGAYGTKDKKFKYSATVERFLSRKYWTKVGVTYKDDVEGLGVIDRFYEINNMFALSTQLGLVDKMREKELYRIWIESDLFPGFNQKIAFNRDYFYPLGNYVFEYFADESKTTRKSAITSSGFTFVSRYAPKEKVVVSNNTRIGIESQRAPMFTLTYSFGIKDFLGGDFDYHLLSLKINQKVKLFALGRFKYEIEGIKVFNQLPYPMLQILPGNETFIYSEKSFNTMNFLEFVSDQNVSLRFFYNFEGAILGKLPLIKKLKLRAVASTNMVYGSLSMENRFYDPENNPQGILPQTTLDGVPLTTYRVFDKGKPFIEISYGVENIFKVLRIQVFHRLTYLYEDAPRWGIKGSLFFMF